MKPKLLTPYTFPPTIAQAKATIQNFPLTLSSCKATTLGSSYLSLLLLAAQSLHTQSVLLVYHHLVPYCPTVVTLTDFNAEQSYNKILDPRSDYKKLIKRACAARLIVGSAPVIPSALILVDFPIEVNEVHCRLKKKFIFRSKTLLKRGLENALKRRLARASREATR